MAGYKTTIRSSDLNEKQIKESRERLERIREYSNAIRPLVSEIEKFAKMAESGKATKRNRDILLDLIKSAEEIGDKYQVKYATYENGIFRPAGARMQVLGAYELSQYKRK